MNPSPATADRLPPPDEPVHMGLPHERYLRPRFLVAAALTLPVLVLAMGPMLWPGLLPHLPARTSAWIQFALTTPVFFWSGWPFIRRWARAIRQRDPNMFLLTVTGTGAAYFFSLGVVLFWDRLPAYLVSHHGASIYFEATAFTTAVVLLGQILEQRAQSRTDAAIRALMNLAPRRAHRLRADGTEEDVPVETVVPGDRLRVRPGEHLPVDGVLLDGPAEIDESMLTGEPLPVIRAAGDKVSAGTLNTTGSFVFRAERVGADTLLARIVRLVEEAVESEPPIARLADRVIAWFFPVVLAIAAVALLGWTLLGGEDGWLHGLLSAVAVLIIACPCALGLATPMSLMVGLGRGAREGVLVRDAASLELLEKTTLLAIDKTGTLTEGRPRLLHVHATAGLTDDELLRRVAALEQHSEHPLAAAIQHAARARGLPLLEATNFTAFPGGGISGTVEDASLLVGSPAFLRSHGVSGLEELLPSAEKALERGETVIFAANQGQAAGWLALADTVKTTTPEALHHLHALGLQVVMVTGDQAPTAAAIARTLGLDHYHAEQTPADKAALVRRWQKEGQRVAMAGDGINDAPALAQADTGIAMGTGADVALQTAGLTLVKGDLRGLVKAFRLSRAIMRNIRQNLLFAYLYNSLGIPLAAGILYPFTGWLPGPMLAGLAMSFSSVSVIANALRLRRVKI